MKLEISKDKVIEAAKTNASADKILRKLFPEVFKRDIHSGVRFIFYAHPGKVYTIIGFASNENLSKATLGFFAANEKYSGHVIVMDQFGIFNHFSGVGAVENDDKYTYLEG